MLKIRSKYENPDQMTSRDREATPSFILHLRVDVNFKKLEPWVCWWSPAIPKVVRIPYRLGRYFILLISFHNDLKMSYERNFNESVTE